MERVQRKRYPFRIDFYRSDWLVAGLLPWLHFWCNSEWLCKCEIERAIIDCNNDSNPDLIFLEGQSSLRNPSGPCGSEFILSGNAKNVFLVHPIEREFFIDLEEKECLLPNIEDEIKLIEAYGANVLGLGINYDGKSTNEFEKIKNQLSDNLSLPVLNPIQDGVSKFVDKIQKTLL